MGLQKHCWQSDSVSTPVTQTHSHSLSSSLTHTLTLTVSHALSHTISPSVWQSLTNFVLAGTCIQPIQGSISCVWGKNILQINFYIFIVNRETGLCMLFSRAVAYKVMYLSTGECVWLIEVHLSSECFQEQFTDCLVDHYICRVSDRRMELLPELCILCRVKPGNSGKVTFFFLA